MGNFRKVLLGEFIIYGLWSCNSHEKVVEGTNRYWCGRCGSWGEHNTANHPGKDDSSTKTEDNEGKIAVHVLNGAMGSNF